MFNGNILRDAIISAANNIANQKNAVDDLNVSLFPTVIPVLICL